MNDYVMAPTIFNGSGPFYLISASFDALNLMEELIDEAFKNRPIRKLVEILI
jgi:hypothetical protein